MERHSKNSVGHFEPSSWDNVILTSRLGKKPGNLGKKVKNVIDSDLYSSRLTSMNQDYAEVTGNMAKFWFTPVLFVMPDSGSVYLKSYQLPMRHLPTRFSFIGGAFALLLLAAGCASNQRRTAQSEPDMLIASGFKVRTPTSTQQTKLQSLTAGQISLIQTRNLTLYVYPDWPNRRVLIGGPVQFQAYQQYRLSQHLPAENPPQVYRGPSSFDWRKWYSEGG